MLVVVTPAGAQANPEAMPHINLPKYNSYADIIINFTINKYWQIYREIAHSF